MNDWQDLHNDNGGEDSHKDLVDVEIEWGSHVVYECQVEVETYRNIPCNTEVVKMERVMFDSQGDGSEVHRIDLDIKEFPHYIEKAAEKKALYSVTP